MNKQIDFYYDFGSPTAYLAWARLLDLSERTGAEIIYHPILLGGVFKITGNSTPVTVKPKGKWMFDDITRQAAHYDIPFAMNPHFIINTITVMRGAIWAQRQGIIEAYNEAVFPAVWAAKKDMGNADVIAQVIKDAGLDADAMAQAAQDPEIKSALVEATEKAVARGIFGAPTMFIGGEMHFGQDRIDWVERALAA